MVHSGDTGGNPVISKAGLDSISQFMCFQSEMNRENPFAQHDFGDFDIRNEERGRPGKKFEDAELQELLDEDATQTQQQLADRLNVAQETISRRLKAMGKIQKMENGFHMN